MRSGSPVWKGGLAETAAGLRDEAAAFSDADLAAALETELGDRFTALVAGIELYRAHPYRRPHDTAAVLWQRGTTRLLDCRPTGGRPLLIVPSLINRWHILDILPGLSLVRFLADAGFRPLVIDWAAPGDDERGFDIAAYVRERLEPALDAVCRLGAGAPIVIGYCMGGMLATALATRREADLAGLVLVATPWDFAALPPLARLLGAIAGTITPDDPATGLIDELPTDLLQSLLAATDPLRAVRKFVKFATVDPASEAAERFVAIEDWANDGVPLSLGVARDCFGGWYGENLPMRGLWQIAGTIVDPQHLTLPTLAIVPTRDALVPRASAQALVEQIAGARLIEVDTGHIGMIVGRNAPTDCWSPLAQWLNGCHRPRDGVGRE